MKGRMLRSLGGAAALALVVAGAPLLAQGAGPTDADLMNDAATPGDVLTYGMGPRAQRFSPLKQIDAGNVAKLVPAFAASLGGEKQRGQEAQPIVYDGTIYVTGSYSRLFAFDARTGEELWRRRTIPAPGEPGDETWGDVPFEERKHVGAWMVPSYDPELNLIYIGTSVTSPAPKFMLGGVENRHLYHNSTLALDADTGQIAWHYQHLNDHWDLDHPFERLLVDTLVAPDPAAVDWINPRLRLGER